jgi:hypothetical protein
MNCSYNVECVIFEWFVQRQKLWHFLCFVLGQICDIWTCSHYVEFFIFDLFVLCRIYNILNARARKTVVTLLFFVRGTICDIFLLRTRREVVLFGFLPNKEDYVCIKLEECPLILFVFSSQKVNIYIIILHIHQRYLYTL